MLSCLKYIYVSTGFISLDCGIANDTNYINTYNIIYISDAQFIETGVNKNIRTPLNNLIQLYQTVRSFPNGNRNCYNLGPVNKSNKYLIRAYFTYGDYDGKNSTPEFDLYMGVNVWNTISFSDATEAFYIEIIIVAPMNFISVCLVNTGSGTPFISGLELRPLNTFMYGVVNESQSLHIRSLNVGGRFDVGGSMNNYYISYPEDPLDLGWQLDEDASWISFDTSQNVTNKDKAMEPPSMVMMTAVRPVNKSDALYFNWTANDSSQKFQVYMHFAELELLGPNVTREFTVCCGNNSCYDSPIRPEYLVTTTIQNPQLLSGQQNYTCSFTKTPNSNFPPILNAIEIFVILQLPTTPTREEDDPIVKHNKAEGLLSSENRRFTYTEVVAMTNNFERSIGKGGFGTVYHGQMPNGTQVAVKTLSLQSVKSLLTCVKALMNFKTRLRIGCPNMKCPLVMGPQLEQQCVLFDVQLLLRVHHRNLVPFIGYCQEGDCTALIYEYMAQGNLGSHLLGTNGCTKALNWGQRLRIALDIAQGLEYLHTGCKPAIIHRDMKTTNILLNEGFEAKIGDFGLSKVFFNDDEQTHISTLVKGTPGYLDPEYFHSNNLTQKSDIYGFGVVLLEMITGQPPIIRSCTNYEKRNLVDWARPIIATRDIQAVLDPRLEGDYDANSLSKVAEIALACTSPRSIERPTMTNIIAELKGCLGTPEISRSLEMEQVGTVSSVSSVLFPRYFHSNNLTQKSDVYGFGVVLLKMITGQPPIIRSKTNHEKKNLVDWARPTIATRDIQAVLVPRLEGDYDANSLSKVGKQR
ncbi:putative LRR receptor-like serine/threonine-protein kinase [Cinnamomum micranthum f. kanehirae]|uniref:Putative LRR receptor-like serine/threonine-protein kinase n=1 Tax=Cinnamomum micranthum f. kanehirae TaxID=337451 RepID=A0A443NI64_9MAGN|nr:putative LRR receptor-like serine/threonine-protein kinase [Cinnamomum micranthum f. kanehirae]